MGESNAGIEAIERRVIFTGLLKAITARVHLNGCGWVWLKSAEAITSFIIRPSQGSFKVK